MKRIVLISLILAVMQMAYAFQINLDPSRVSVTMKPGSTVRRSLVISNTGDDAVNVKVYLNDWFLKEGKKNFLPLGSTPYSLKNSAKAFPNNFILKPKESKSVILTLTAEKKEFNADYGVVFFEAYPVSKAGQSGVTLGGRIGSIIYKEIEGYEAKNYSIKQFQVASNNEKVDVSLNLINTGNVIVDPVATLLIVDDKNEVLQKDILNELMVLPGEQIIKKYSLPLKKQAIGKKITAVMTLDFGNDEIVVKESKVN